MMQTCCGATAPTRLSSGTCAAGSRAAASAATSGGNVVRARLPTDKDVAASRCRAAADRRDTSRPGRCRTGCRSGAAAAARMPPSQRCEADCGEARQHEERAQARGRMQRGIGCVRRWMGRHGRALPASQAACRSAVYSGSDKCAASRLASVRQYAGDTSMAAIPAPRCRRCVPARRAHWHHLRHAAARAWLHAGMRCTASSRVAACITMSCQRIVP